MTDENLTTTESIALEQRWQLKHDDLFIVTITGIAALGDDRIIITFKSEHVNKDSGQKFEKFHTLLRSEFLEEYTRLPDEV